MAWIVLNRVDLYLSRNFLRVFTDFHGLVVQWLVINVDNGFLAHQIVLPLLNNLNQGIEFLIICKVVQDNQPPRPQPL